MGASHHSGASRKQDELSITLHPEANEASELMPVQPEVNKGASRELSRSARSWNLTG